MSQATRVEPAQVLVERVHEDRERKVSLELRRGACKDEPALAYRRERRTRRAGASSRSRARRRARSRRRRPIDLGEHLVERPELLGAADEVIGKQGHSFSNQGRSGSPEPAKSGWRPDVGAAARRQSRRMARYLLHHHHEPHECGVVFASFRGHESPLRHRTDARLVSLRRTRDLVDGRSGNRRGRARAAARATSPSAPPRRA